MSDLPVTLEINKLLARIAVALERLANDGQPVEPNLRRPIGEYNTFDWAEIGATVVGRDADGATLVEFEGTLWARRSPSNKFDPAVWYSRSNGKDAEGNVRYLRLISFQTIRDVDPLPEKAKAATHVQPPAKAATDQAEREKFIIWATEKKFSLTTEAATWIADHAPSLIVAHQLAPIAAQAKAGGLTGKVATGILEVCAFDPDKCQAMVMDRIAGKGS